MTDANPTLSAEDIVDDLDADRVTLDQAGDQWLAEGEGKAFAREQGVRGALRSDLGASRAWAREQAAVARHKIEDEPMKATLYALGVGVLIGLLLRR